MQLAGDAYINAITFLKDYKAADGKLSIGSKVAVIGELQARTYEAKDGTTRMSLDVSADEVEFLTPKSADDSQSGYSAPRPQASAQDLAGFTDINSDDLPF